ncbi:hypothetical protein CDAR_254161 [Caerostris darwini]|uniref:ribonuclease H n=1 Tax=Caerostris darwini TaxID=1538125 RepID=A0AAV4MET0_9ARAC|nr:hypothetical protein CDAR_254161 [Caerostris darwini]
MPRRSIKIGANKIKYTQHLKYLGLHFDPKLNWVFHLNTIQDKLNSLQQKLYRITRATWGLNPTVKKDIYNKVINRIIHYGHEIWYQGRVKQDIKLNQLQRSGLLNITKCYKTVSTDALQVLAGVPPIDIQTKHTHKMFQIKNQYKEIQTQGLAFHPGSITFLKPILPPWNKTSFHWSHYKDNLQGTLIYTDGSKMNNRVGGAFVAYKNNVETYHQCFRLNDQAMVYMAELTAIDKAIDYSIAESLPSSNIITDSRSVLLALENVNCIDHKILELKNKLNNFTGEIHLFWIKAHIGHLGNERADVLAKTATNQANIDFNNKFELQSIKKLINNDIMKEWQDRWRQSHNGRDVFVLFQNVDIKRVQGDFFLIQIISDHGTIAAYQARLFKKDPLLCVWPFF